jgi:hypothetical protein
MHYLSSVYSATVSLLPTVGGPADSRLRRTTRQNCHTQYTTYTLLTPDDGLLASLKHVAVKRFNKLKMNSASSWFHYTHLLDASNLPDTELNIP